MAPVEEDHLVADDVEKRPYGLYGEVLEASRLVLLLVLLWRVSWEELSRYVEEARRAAPDLSGLDKAPQYLEWRATGVTTSGRQIEAATAHPWQLRWYFSLLGEEKSFRGRGDVTKEDIKFLITAYWPREREDQILKESRWLESLLGQRVENWRQLVDAIDWSWVLKKVEELTGKLRSWIGPEKMDDKEREGLARRMLGELALLVHFAEARRGKSDGEWREERVRRLAEAVEALSGGRIAGDHAVRLARAIIRYAEGHKKEAGEDIDRLAGELGGALKEDVNRVKGEVWGVVEFVLSDMYCLARDCARDEVVRKFVAPALELIMLDKARNKEFDRKEALRIFGEMYATAVAGDGTVGPDRIVLAVGGELGRGAALVRLATLHLLNQLLAEAQKPEPDELRFNVRVYIGEDVYRIAGYGENAARFNRILAVTAPSAGGEYLSPKFDELVEEVKVEVRVDNIRQTERRVAADLIISVDGIEIKYNVYLDEDAIKLQFVSTDRSRVELAARLLRHAGVNAEVKKVGSEDMWQVWATTDMLAAGRKELRDAVRKVVEEALKNGGVDEEKARRWLEKLEKGMAVWEGKKFMVGLSGSGALVVRFSSANRESLEEVAREFKAMGLVEGVHFAVRWSGGRGYVSLLAEGVRRLAWLSIHGEGEQRRRAAEFLKFLEKRAEAKGEEVLKKLEALVEEGRSRGALRLVGLEKDGVKVLDVEAEEKGDKLYITIKAEIDGVEEEYEITLYREGRGTRRFVFYVRGEEAVARTVKLIEVLTGERPSVTERPNSLTRIGGSWRHIDALARYEELREAIERWSNR